MDISKVRQLAAGIRENVGKVIIGKERVIWRFDPILINDKYTVEYHIQAFEKMAKKLHKYTNKVTISFIDIDYRIIKSNLNKLRLHEFNDEIYEKIADHFSKIAKSHGLLIDTCAEAINLKKYSIERACCVDRKLFEKLLDYELTVDKDKNQRAECGCISSIDIGMYNTCKNGCMYCYANYCQNSVPGNAAKHDKKSPILLGTIDDDIDKITEREVKSFKSKQKTLSFD